MKKVFKLCYVDGNAAYFTTQSPTDQWGDDWDDAPYEHNAGSPYEWDKHDEKEGKPKWEIMKVYFEGDFQQPTYSYDNSPYSVQDINRGAIAWLTSSTWIKEKIIIPAGTTYEEFIVKIKKVGGRVFTEI